MADTIEKVIYSPPKKGLPHLVVTIANGEVVDSVAVPSRDAARATIAEQGHLIRKTKQELVAWNPPPARFGWLESAERSGTEGDLRGIRGAQ